MYKKYLKRIFDIIISFCILIILSPLLLVITVLLAISFKGNPFFLHKRPGENADIFTLIKFKTMNDRKDKKGVLLTDVERLTSIGKILRKTSIDELLQFINVIIGDMSIIGPRPLLINYLPLYNEEQKKRHSVKPGITGWAQVNGRNIISWEKKFEYDSWYVENFSFILDFKIFWLTVKKVVQGKDISSNSSVTMEAFKGNK